MEFIDGVDIGKYFSEYDELDSVILGQPTPDEIFIQLINAF